jgi:hypothetical protein
VRLGHRRIFFLEIVTKARVRAGQGYRPSVSTKKEFRELLSAVEAQGGTIRKIRSGYQVFAPNGVDIVTLHGTPSDRRALANAIAELRRAGFTLKRALMDSFRLRLSISDVGRDPSNGERLLDAFMKSHPQAGPVVSQSLRTGRLVVTIAVEAADITEALVKGVPIFVDGLGASKLPPSDLLDLSASLIPADELDETRELQPA